MGGGTLTFTGAGATNGLLNSYTNTIATSSQGQSHIPSNSRSAIHFGHAELPLWPRLAWNGATGGVLAIDVSSQLTLGGTVCSRWRWIPRRRRMDLSWQWDGAGHRLCAALDQQGQRLEGRRNCRNASALLRQPGIHHDALGHQQPSKLMWKACPPAAIRAAPRGMPAAAPRDPDRKTNTQNSRWRRWRQRRHGRQRRVRLELGRNRRRIRRSAFPASTRRVDLRRWRWSRHHE